MPDGRTQARGDGRLTVIICTRNRRDELRAALTSLYAGTSPPDQVIVSDDGEDAHELAQEFPLVEFRDGPKRGLGPNRNAALAWASSSRISFIDDDVIVPSDFVARARQCRSGVVTTGWELNFAGAEPRRVESHNATFLGFQRVPVGAGVRQSIVINATVFPAALFERASFDDNVKYGYEEADIARHAVALGHEIAFDPELWVEHHPSAASRDGYQAELAVSRIYLTHKAYRHYERRRLKAGAFLAVAYTHALASAGRRGRFGDGLRAVKRAHALVRRSASTRGALV